MREFSAKSCPRHALTRYVLLVTVCAMVIDVAPRGAKFRLLAEQLRDSIRVGRWPVGDRLPAEQELAASYQVSINTVRRAVDELIGDRLVQRRQGSGTWVLAKPARAGLQGRFVGVLVPQSSYVYP